MKKMVTISLALLLAAFLLQGCGDDSSSNSQDLRDLIGDDGGGNGGGLPPGEPGELGNLVDLGDLIEPVGDHWYFTRARVINDAGTIVGESNQGDITRGAFQWEPDTGDMTFLGVHDGSFEDFYMQLVEDPLDFVNFFAFSEAIDINNFGAIIGNSLTGAEGIEDPNEGEKRAFLWQDGMFTDLPPIPGIVREFRAPGTDGPADEGEIDFEITNYSEAADINDKGEVVLTLDDNTEAGRHAYYWDGMSFTNAMIGRDDISLIEIVVPDYQPLSTIVGATSEAVAINENGQVIINSAGEAIFVDRNLVESEGFLISETIGDLPGAGLTVAVDINDSAFVNADGIPDGHVIGNSGNFSKPVMEDFLGASFLNASQGLSLQDAGLTDVQGFFWDGGAMYPVDHLGGGASLAADLNNKDQVVGGALTAEGATHAFIWTLGDDEKGIIQDLGTLGGEHSMALAINEAGQVVGWSETGDFYEEQGVVLPIRHGFLWDNGKMYDLGSHDDFYDFAFTPPYPFSEAVDINENGELTGNSVTINDHPRGFYLDPALPAP